MVISKTVADPDCHSSAMNATCRMARLQPEVNHRLSDGRATSWRAAGVSRLVVQASLVRGRTDRGARYLNQRWHDLPGLKSRNSAKRQVTRGDQRSSRRCPPPARQELT